MNRKIIWSTLCLGIAVFTGTTVWSQQAPSVKESTGLGKAHFGLRQLHEEYQAYLAQPGSKAPSFKSSNSFIRQVDGHVAVDIVAADPNSLIGQLQTLGMKNIAVYKNMASGLLPLEEIANIVAINEVRSVRPVLAKTNVGSVTSQGDPAMMSDDARAQWNIDGTGITVGTLSDSYNDLGGASADVASNDLPSGVTVLADLGGGGTDEGRAMMQLIHDVAPGVDQAFHTAFLGQADFALGIEELAGCPPGSAVGCTPVAGVAADVIVDDIIYFAEPMFQDGIIAQAVDHVKANGVAYFSAAGNSARQSFESFGFAPSGVLDPIFGTELHAFDGASDAFQSVTIPVGGAALMVLQWDQPFFSVSGAPGSTNDLDLFLFDSTGSTALTGSVISNVGGDPVEIFQFINDGSFGTEQFNIGISLFSGPAPGILKYVYFGDIIINEYDTQSSTIYGHANALGAEAVGAAFYLDTPDFGVSPPILEPFSSVGYTDIRFDTAGNAVYSARDKPDIVAPDGADTTFFLLVSTLSLTVFPISSAPQPLHPMPPGLLPCCWNVTAR
ncbi:MAG: peptidase S8 [Candidatus Competibacteraceae bacterium]|nr:peptidase S8 [Candidatus Competibacteraceae bacterium]